MAAASDRWTYQVVNIKPSGFVRQQIDPEETARVLNERGAQGWELVSAAPITSYQSTSSLTLVFKRPG